MPLSQTLPLRFQAKGSRKVPLLVIAVAFVVAGIYMLPAWPVRGWSAIVFFGLGAAALAVNLLPGSSYLLLEEDGLTVCNVFRKTFYSWNDIAEFLPIEVGTKTMVGVRFHEKYKASAFGRKLATLLSGADGALPDNYGQDVQYLVLLLNGARAKQAP